MTEKLNSFICLTTFVFRTVFVGICNISPLLKMFKVLFSLLLKCFSHHSMPASFVWLVKHFNKEAISLPVCRVSFCCYILTAHFPHITKQHPKTPRSEHRATLSNKPTEACCWFLGSLTLYRGSLSKWLASQPGKKVGRVARQVHSSRLALTRKGVQHTLNLF